MTPAAKRQAVAHACAVHGVSERRACRILGVDRASMRYRSRRPGETDVRLRIRALAHRRRRFGYRRTVRKRQRRTHAHGSFASAALAHLQFLFTVKPPKAFVVHAPSLPSQQHMQAPVAEATPPVRQCSNAQPHIGLAGTAAAVAH